MKLISWLKILSKLRKLGIAIQKCKKNRIWGEFSVGHQNLAETTSGIAI